LAFAYWYILAVFKAAVSTSIKLFTLSIDSVFTSSIPFIFLVCSVSSVTCLAACSTDCEVIFVDADVSFTFFYSSTCCESTSFVAFIVLSNYWSILPVLSFSSIKLFVVFFVSLTVKPSSCFS
jgi:hypothetical protein